MDRKDTQSNTLKEETKMQEKKPKSTKIAKSQEEKAEKQEKH